MNAISGKGQEIGQPINSNNRSETADGVTRESEVGSWLSLLRVCMTAAMLVLKPIFEVDLPDELYAYRPGRNAQQAVIEVEETLFHGRREVVDADLADYFGSIPHAELMLSLARRIEDKRVLHLIKM